ncbi:DUF3365 domain-containing protein [Roseiconus nitratireducens]|uniref:DUF3365 domain-containing protein n=1 Tax=Roseiconus nitratireducens TaxID=2605748 RepID=A0A5M6CW04_9BACT|nr:DUF3365 domain-containing protein [Roseiconus nitratireducens]KAA5539417.1 DUF3365 domain-containing protein [Roseiconus nitratireducens]
MKRNRAIAWVLVCGALGAYQIGIFSPAWADEKQETASTPKQVDEDALERTRATIKLLDNIFKQTVVMVTEKYVHDEDDFAAGSAAVLLFKNISDSSDHQVRLIDASGDPYDSENVAKDRFEKEGIAKLKAGAKGYEKVVVREDQPFLRALTPVPVVMQKCVMCHPHYADVKEGQPIGAISYTVPIR